MILLVDVGNSRIKWGICEASGSPNVIEFGGSFAYQASKLATDLHHAWQHLPKPIFVMIGNVAGSAVQSELAKFCLNQWKLTPQFVVAKNHFKSFQMQYDKPELFGVDRFLAIIAAMAKFPTPLCVFDSGTAITVDVVGKDGQYQGGLILPGMELIANALSEHTDGCHFDEAEVNPEADFLGMDTSSQIALGSKHMLSAFVNEVANRLLVTYQDDLTIVLTGGDLAKLSLMIDTPHVYQDPLLVLEGLQWIFAEGQQEGSR